MVREHIGVIILAIFIVIAVLGPIGCIVYSRRREHMKFHPSPKAFRQAQKKLGTVAECRKGDEKGLSGDAEWTDNCPICIGSLSSAQPNEEDANSTNEKTAPTAAGGGREGEEEEEKEEASGSNATAAADEVQVAEASNSGDTGGEKSNVTPGDTGGTETQMPSPAASRSPVIERMSTCLPMPLSLALRKHAGRASSDRNTDILKLKSCGHWFHARCLSSWFLIDRYDCPVCRKSYWDAPPKRPTFHHWLHTSYHTNATRLGAGAFV